LNLGDVRIRKLGASPRDLRRLGFASGLVSRRPTPNRTVLQWAARSQMGTPAAACVRAATRWLSSRSPRASPDDGAHATV